MPIWKQSLIGWNSEAPSANLRSQWSHGVGMIGCNAQDWHRPRKRPQDSDSEGVSWRPPIAAYSSHRLVGAIADHASYFTVLNAVQYLIRQVHEVVAVIATQTCHPNLLPKPSRRRCMQMVYQRLFSSLLQQIAPDRED